MVREFPRAWGPYLLSHVTGLRALTLVMGNAPLLQSIGMEHWHAAPAAPVNALSQANVRTLLPFMVCRDHPWNAP